MEIGSAGAGSIAQIAPTQTGSQQQVVQAQSQQDSQVEQSPQPEQQQTSPPVPQRVGTVVDVEV